MASLRFILGRAGTGKTHTCLTEIATHLQKQPIGSPLIFIVPDQATFQVERALTSVLPNQGFSRVQVLSFSRLAIAILNEVGGLANPELSPLGKQMLLRSLLVQHQEQLSLFSHAARQPGFILKLESAIQELNRYNHQPGQLNQIAERLSASAMRQKLREMSLLWQAFQQALAEREAGLDEHLHKAIAMGPQARLTQEAEVWVDGFTSFTPLEQNLLLMLVRHSRAVHLALCLDPTTWPEVAKLAETPQSDAAEVDDHKADAHKTDAHQADLIDIPESSNIFYRTQDTFMQVLQSARAANVRIEPPLCLVQTRRFIQPELQYLEAGFTQTLPQPYPAKAPAIELIAAVNRRAEVEAVGRKILHLCRDRGYRYRDIGIITRDLEHYGDVLKAVFADLEIPCFIDQRTSIAHHPVVELLRSALEVCLSHWDLRALMRCLKTDLLPLPRTEVDKLENYALEHGLRGSAWHSKQEWRYGLRTYEPDPEQIARVKHLDALRRQVVELFAPLEPFSKRQPLSAKDACVALYDFLIKAGVPQQLQDWADHSADTGDIQEGMLQQQVWDACMELLEQMQEAVGDAQLTVTEFAQILESGLENLQLGVIPPTLDQVLVGSVDRSRQPHLRAVFVLGVGERSFPAAGGEDAMFTDLEREHLARIGFALGPTSVDQALQEHYLGYIAFTRAAEYLWISYPLTDDDGRALAPSLFVNRLRSIFPQLEAETVGNEPDGAVAEALPWLTSIRRAAAAAARCLQLCTDPVNRAAWTEIVRSIGADPLARRILSSLQHTHSEADLAMEVAAELAGVPLRSSISRLESFAACPFRHFAQYLLRLSERPEFRVQFTDEGLLVHETMHAFVRELQTRGWDWATLSEEVTQQLVDTLVDEVAPQMHNSVFMSSARYQYLVARMKRILRTVLWVWGKHAQRGRYQPLLTEAVFGDARYGTDQLPGLNMTLPNGETLALHGRIDRIDTCADADATYIRVIDYKGSGAAFSVADIYHGLHIQLVAYLNVALQAAQLGRLPQVDNTAGAQPGGAYYFNVRERFIDATQPREPEELEQMLLKEYRLKGVTLGTPGAIRCAEESGKGELVPARLNKDGQPASSPLAISAERFEQLFAHIQQLMINSAQQILNGTVQARPYRYPNGKNACTFCSYHPLCHFDLQIPGDRYRHLEYQADRTAWQLFDQHENVSRGKPNADMDA
jgi:ATP-dependent helicase/nuclease subunit B